MIYCDLKFLDDLNKAETIKYNAFTMQNSSLSVLSFNKLIFFKINLITAE